MHRRFKETSYIPFLLNPETRSDVIPVRCHFCESLRQARLLISHRKVCVNQEIVEHCHWKVSHGDIISFQEDYARIRGEEIRRFFYIESSLEERIGDFLNRPVRMWRRTKIKWYNLLKTKRGCRIVLEESFLQKLRSSMQKEDFEKTKKLFLGRLHRNFAEHKRKRRNLYHSKFLSKRTKDQKLDIPSLRIRSALLDFLDSFSLDRNSTDCSASDHEFTRKIKRLTKKMSRDIISKSKKLPNRYKKRVELPTHYSEVNYRTPKAVVSYRPNIGNIPHDIRLKDPNLLLRSGQGRGQNI
uniref:Ribosomal protein S4 n=1 Tax=Codonopsis lanceolata TaxID=103999 RepID=A0A2U8XGZ4_9ASTR|nr:ribosomal protein S4 [Codonopsis lanceolata]AWN57609.1 ribosomal protein S4 [Codonopsis lanceolata]